jgi:D-3-phosphoglycerate dehydrogenase
VKRVLIAAPISEKFKKFLIEKNYELRYLGETIIEAELQATIVGIVTSNRLLLDKNNLQQYSALQWIARLGSGMEIIDTEYCTLHNIFFCSAPQGIANSVAEHTIGMLLGLIHRISSANNEIKAGKWIREPNRGIELENQVVGIIGYGHTGSAVAKKLAAFTNHILVYDKYKTGFSNTYLKETSLAELQEKASIISFHVPLKSDTFHYYNDAFCDAMQHNHILINTSRGAVANTDSILKGLEKGKISGACLDVLEEEKNIENVLTETNNKVQQFYKYQVILTPHIAGYSLNAIEKMSQELLDQLKIIL